MRYRLSLTTREEAALPNPMWFAPSEVRVGFHDIEDSLDAAIKATRFYERMCGFAVKREAIES